MDNKLNADVELKKFDVICASRKTSDLNVSIDKSIFLNKFGIFEVI